MSEVINIDDRAKKLLNLWQSWAERSEEGNAQYKGRTLEDAKAHVKRALANPPTFGEKSDPPE